MLIEVADRLGQCVRSEDTVVRLGGDEFAVLLPDTGPKAAAGIARRILAELRAPFTLDGLPLHVTGSIGIASAPDSGPVDLNELLRNADLAMYATKAGGRDGVTLFDRSMLEDARERLVTDTELRAAVAEQQFTVYYQPIVQAVDGEVRAVEALVRWNHPIRGILAPSEFLAAAERTGLIVEVGRQVLDRACAQIVQWRADRPDLELAVNVSQRELLHPAFAAHIESVLGSHGLDPTTLHLEVTESVVAAEENIHTVLAPLAAIGVKFSIDDFGTGHSSLSRLRHLHVERLKIDKSFIAEIHDDLGRSAPLLASIISLAHSIGRKVIAEGVETQGQASFLTQQGCDELQGYLFSRPVPPEHLVPVLNATAASRSGARAVDDTADRVLPRPASQSTRRRRDR